MKATAQTETAQLKSKNEAIEKEKLECIEKFKECELKNEGLVKKIEVAEETTAEFKCKNRDLENYAKELKAEFEALKSKQAMEQINANSEEIEEETEINFDTKAYLPYGFDPCKGMIKSKVEPFKYILSPVSICVNI